MPVQTCNISFPKKTCLLSIYIISTIEDLRQNFQKFPQVGTAIFADLKINSLELEHFADYCSIDSLKRRPFNDRHNYCNF